MGQRAEEQIAVTLLDIIRFETLGFDTISLYSIIVLITALCSQRQVHYKVIIQSDNCISYFHCRMVTAWMNTSCQGKIRPMLFGTEMQNFRIYRPIPE